MSSSGSGSGSGGRRGSNESHSSGESAPNLGQRSPPQPPPPPPQNPGQNRPPKNPSAGQRSQPPPPQNPPQTLPKNPPPPQKPAPPNETYALTHSSWKPPPVAGPSDHGINYGGSGAQNKYGYGAYKEKHQHYSRDYSNIRHNPSAVGQDQFMYHCDQHATAEYNYPPNLDCGGSAPSSSEEVRDLYCCQPEAVSKACSNDPNCHMFKDTCRPGNFADSFPNRFKLPKGGRPSWLVHCGKILRFFAFYQEPIPESMIENYRIHQCEIRYFLDDGTIEVIEPKTFDPGFPQGRIIRRHKIPYPRPAHNATYSLEDLDVGCQVTFYGKTFFISGVDDATRVHLNRKEGRQVLANLEMPEDLYTNWRKDRIFSLFSRKGSINLESEKAKKFIANTGKVLRFWAYWDNRCEYGGELKKYIFHYFLQDDTVEIKEIVDPEGGVRGAITFLGKGKLLKDHKDLVPTVGIREDALLILNTVGGGNSCKHAIAPSYMTDSLCPGIDEKDFVTDKDLAIGAVINVYGRLFTLVDCDKATQTYYREKYGIDDFTPLVLEKSETERASPRVQVPPHIGIGTEADTLHNWDKLEPVPPPKQENLPEFRAKDKDVLCFEAQFYNAQHNANADRRFIIKIFMMDNKMQIFEKPHPNTGFKQGQFLARSMIRKRGHGLRPAFELGEESEYYEMKDYFIGNVLDINGFTFLLTGADEFTLSYMEANSSVFPQANFCLIIDKVREAFGPLESESVLQLFSCKDSQLNGIISRDDFRSILVTLMKQSLNEHEITTLLRGLKVDPPKVGIDFKTLQ
ncbi:EF-hand domain-containing family member C2-like [Folsomia candida]|nr:EF-hand domain-containing family member C2-like [Folsomia candida]